MWERALAIHAKQVLTDIGWQSDVRIVVHNGHIQSLQAGVRPQPDDECHTTILPSMPNLHSHAFQRGMAGLAEMPGSTSDNFWSWRDIMYRFALSVTPDDVEAIAAQLYVEMLEAGFTRVGEFHYLHHAPDGSPYANSAEMATRLAAAALDTGIGLTLLPVFYAHSGFGGQSPGEGQRRFITSLSSFERLLSDTQDAVKPIKNAVVGIAPHSLRAVTPEELVALQKLDFDGPIHIHVAEQTGEVDACLAWSGKRPVEWLLDHMDVNAHWCFIHVTHMTDVETRRMAEAGVIAGLCPITEANLGDGTFPAGDFSRYGGRFGIGSDSNVLIGLADELRQLEYSQRLSHRARTVLASGDRSTGRSLIEDAMTGGGLALHAKTGLAKGKPYNALSLKIRHALPYDADRSVDHWIFANGADIDCVWMEGDRLVTGGKHRARQAISSRFHRAMQPLLARI
jgi:formiminoglutamate deiminase